MVQLRDFLGLKDRKPVREGAFHGCYEKRTYLKADPLISWTLFDDGTIELVGRDLPVYRLRVPRAYYYVAARSAAFDDLSIRYRNVLEAFRSSRHGDAELLKDPQFHLLYDSVIAFVLVGIIDRQQKLRWLNDVDEWQPIYYYCEPPADFRDRMPRSLVILDDVMPLEAKQCRKVRAAPVRVRDVVPEFPAWWDVPTNLAGLAKRLYPETITPQPYAINELRRLTSEFITKMARAPLQVQTREEIFAEACKGRPRYEIQAMREGFDMYVNPNTRDAAIEEYLKQSYKAFWKLEHYLRRSNKPPRYIMSLPLKYRGMQVAAMGPALFRIEQFTSICNVKHLTQDQITAKLKQKFANFPLVAETDFSSFESCISPLIQSVIEIPIFRAASDAADAKFIDLALGRKSVCVKGPGFVDTNFHHIRMSGDYWTSLGNLVTNLIVLCFCSETTLDDMMMNGLFEGDDGVFPAPKDVARVMNRAHDAGMYLTFSINKWQSLSFCGQQFHEWEDGELHRCRNPYKTLCSLTSLLGASSNSHSQDIMLQRSKCLSVIDGPWVPGASAFACLFEFYSRFSRVDEEKLLRQGKLKEWSGYGLESCVPCWLKACHTRDEVCKWVAYREGLCGGVVTAAKANRVLSQMETGEITERLLPDDPSDYAWVHKNGAKYTTTKYALPLCVDRYDSGSSSWVASFDGRQVLPGRGATMQYPTLLRKSLVPVWVRSLVMSLLWHVALAFWTDFEGQTLGDRFINVGRCLLSVKHTLTFGLSCFVLAIPVAVWLVVKLRGLLGRIAPALHEWAYLARSYASLLPALDLVGPIRNLRARLASRVYCPADAWRAQRVPDHPDTFPSAFASPLDALVDTSAPPLNAPDVNMIATESLTGGSMYFTDANQGVESDKTKRD